MKTSSFATLATAVFIAATPVDEVRAERSFDWAAAEQVRIFESAFELAGLKPLVDEGKSFTLFVPSDFALRIEGTAGLLQGVYATPRNRERLIDLMHYHYVPDRKLDLASIDATEVRTQSGEALSLERRGYDIFLNGHIRVMDSIDLGRGTVHIVSGLLWADLAYDDPKQTAGIVAGGAAQN